MLFIEGIFFLCTKIVALHVYANIFLKSYVPITNINMYILYIIIYSNNLVNPKWHTNTTTKLSYWSMEKFACSLSFNINSGYCTSGLKNGRRKLTVDKKFLACDKRFLLALFQNEYSLNQCLRVVRVFYFD